MIRLLFIIAGLVVIVLFIRPVGANEDCQAIRASARAYIQTAQDLHQLTLWAAQGWPVEHLADGWKLWYRIQEDPKFLTFLPLYPNPQERDAEWVRRYSVVLEALKGCAATTT